MNSTFDDGRVYDSRQKFVELVEANRITFEEFDDAVFVVHCSSGKIFEANEKAAEIAGYPITELHGMVFEKLIPKKEITTFQDENSLSKSILRKGDGTFVMVDISTRWILHSKKRLKLVFITQVERSSSHGHFFVRKSLPNSKDTAPYEFPNIIGKSEKIRKVCHLVGRVAKTDSTILIYGESGTGKELIAQAIHSYSTRSKGPFVKVNCAALTETLLESELFGHVKGAFTGAIKDNRGRFRQAEGGTILLDEIASMSLSGQAKLLRILEERKFEPVGSSVTIPVNVRVIAACNTDLEKAVVEGRFREDLYYRICIFPIFVPPLRNRIEDVPLLARHFLRKHNLNVGRDIGDLTPETLNLLMQYDWPGNVRELANAIEHAVIVCKGSTILPSDLPLNVKIDDPARQNVNATIEEPGLRDKLNLLEKQIILNALERANGIKMKAAALLKVDPRNLPYLIRKHNISKNGQHR